MKPVFYAVAFCAALGCQVSWAQAASECKPSVTNVPEAKYPCVYPDNRALFRVVAPDAQKVRVRIGQGFDMQKGPDGIWSVTTAQPIRAASSVRCTCMACRRRVSQWPKDASSSIRCSFAQSRVSAWCVRI